MVSIELLSFRKPVLSLYCPLLHMCICNSLLLMTIALSIGGFFFPLGLIKHDLFASLECRN